MNDKNPQNDTVQSTMLIPLYGRMIAGRRFPDILRDVSAERICESVAYDFSGIAKTYGGEYAAVCCLIRAARMDERAGEYIAAHPDGTVVNLGAGLDDTFSRVDNGCVLWYNLDLPDAIAYRGQFIEPTGRCRNIGKSMFDYTWLDDVKPPSGGSVLILAAGLFFYFERAQIKELFSKISKHFPSGELFFDALSKSGMKIANKMVRHTGNTGAKMKFWVNHASEVRAWSPEIKKAVCLSYFGARVKDKRLSAVTRLVMLGGDFLGRTKFVRVKWSGEGLKERAGKIAKAYKSSKNYYDDALTGKRWWSKLYMNAIWGADDWEIAERLFEYLPNGFCGKLLDVPTGTGLFTADRYKRMPRTEITALDYSETMLEKARERFSGCRNVTCVRGDAGNLRFGDATFDVVFSMNGFHVFSDKEAAFCETVRVLRPGGLFLSTFYVEKQRRVTDAFVKACLKPKGFFTPPYWTKAELETILRRYYREIELRTMGGMVILRCVK
jgi:O-methyltransferase involved in polyketide biosynthesis/ubiquinone/menaquinone biosynthesis C-methylase UbiE